MNSISQDQIVVSPVYNPSRYTDARGLKGLASVLKLQEALKEAPDYTVFGVLTTDPLAAAYVEDFCARIGHDYLGEETFDDHRVDYVRKRTVECQKCSKIRVVILAGLILGALAYTTPQVVLGNPSGWVTVVFVGALASLPAVALDNLRLLKRLWRKRHRPT